jgi:cytoskeletal protein RodZ
MSTTSPEPDAASAPPDGEPKQPRNVWVWICGVLVLVAVGLLLWALSSRSDLDSAQADLASTEQQVESTQQELDAAREQLESATPQPTPTATPSAEEDDGGGGRAGLVAAGALITGLARELGATKEDAAATEQELADAQKTADKAEQDAEAAKQQADDATDDAAKAKAQADQADAERDAAQAKATIAADCAKSYISAFADLFGSGNVRDQVPDVREQLSAITADCKSTLAGTP